MSKNEEEMSNYLSQIKEKQANEIEKIMENHNEEKREWNEIRESKINNLILIHYAYSNRF